MCGEWVRGVWSVVWVCGVGVWCGCVVRVGVWFVWVCGSCGVGGEGTGTPAPPRGGGQKSQSLRLSVNRYRPIYR
jgi:hypothetical protein